MFGKLKKSTCDGFLADTHEAESRWIRDPNAFNQATEIKGLLKLYTNYASADIWTKGEEKHTQVIVIATTIFKEKRNNVEMSKDSGTPRMKKKGKYGTGKTTTPTNSGFPKHQLAYEGNAMDMDGFNYK